MLPGSEGRGGLGCLVSVWGRRRRVRTGSVGSAGSDLVVLGRLASLIGVSTLVRVGLA